MEIGLERRAEMMRRGLRMAPEKVRRRRLYHLPSVKIIVLFFALFLLIFLFCFVVSKCVSKEIKK